MLTLTVDFRKELAHRIEENGNKGLSDIDLMEFSKKLIQKLKKSNSVKLYRYMPFNYNSVRSIETGSIYLSEVGKMNDVFEGLTLTHSNKNISFNTLNDLIYLKSFCEEKDNLLMWSHYADNHKGICIEYDLTYLISKIDDKKSNPNILFHLFPVVYLENRINDEAAFNNLLYASKSINQYKLDLKNKNHHDDVEWHNDIKMLFLIKSKSWGYEKEWRIAVTFTQMNEKPKYLDESLSDLYTIDSQNVDFDCITSIYCGANLENDKVEHLKEIAKRVNNNSSRRLSVYRSQLDPKEYKLNYERIL
jgi:hypothetical protein